MEQEQLKNLLESLIAEWESEIVEFKEANDDYPTSKIGRYFSAIANEANLRGKEKGWLVFGVNNKSRSITNTTFRTGAGKLQEIKQSISSGTEPSVTFRNIHEYSHSANNRVLIFEIPAAPAGMPIAWNGYYFGRSNESLVALSIDKLDEIRSQEYKEDWSAQTVPEAGIEHLDTAAITKARESFARKHSNRLEKSEVVAWSDITFLDRARITQNGKITRTALLLLGKAESVYLLSPHPAQITWKLEGPERAYEHFSPPFFLETSELYKRIRNIQMRILPDDELLPIEVSKYDQKIILEALHNCIAHQDYTKNARVVVTEQPEKLIFENEGNFFEGSPDDYIEGDKTPRRYRNPFLVHAMVELNMIDTMGYGIHQMHIGQAKRYFPLPDYDLSEGKVVKMTIYGGVVDPAYSKLLMQKTDLSLTDILALDRVQKKLPIPPQKVQQLKRAKLVEGRKPNLHVSAYVAAATSNKASYIKTRSLDDDYFKKLIEDYIREFGKASRGEIDEFLSDKLSSALTEYQKQRKIGNLLTSMRRAGSIYNAGSRTKSEWKFAE